MYSKIGISGSRRSFQYRKVAKKSDTSSSPARSPCSCRARRTAGRPGLVMRLHRCPAGPPARAFLEARQDDEDALPVDVFVLMEMASVEGSHLDRAIAGERQAIVADGL